MQYKVTFTPSGAYFFGNEKRFEYGKSSAQYFISGEKMPSQSTLLGALRYILLPQKGFDKIFDKENTDAIGPSGFNMDSKEEQNFGKIKGVSAVFINKGDEFFIPTPFDHNCKPKNKDDEIKFYTPMVEYVEFLSPASNEQKVFLNDYDVKEGIADSFMSVKDGHLEKDLFKTDVRIGIDKKKSKEAFFKKAYVCLKKEFSFCVFADIEDDSLDGKNDVVVLGQGKVPFGVKFENAEKTCVNKRYKETGLALVLKKAKETIENAASENIKYERVYCISDILSVNDIYSGTEMAIVQTKDYRSFYTSKNEEKNTSWYVRGTELHRLVKAGSVFVFKRFDENKWNIPSKKEKTSIKQINNAKKIGYNQILHIHNNLNTDNKLNADNK